MAWVPLLILPSAWVLWFKRHSRSGEEEWNKHVFTAYCVYDLMLLCVISFTFQTSQVAVASRMSERTVSHGYQGVNWDLQLRPQSHIFPHTKLLLHRRNQMWSPPPTLGLLVDGRHSSGQQCYSFSLQLLCDPGIFSATVTSNSPVCHSDSWAISDHHYSSTEIKGEGWRRETFTKNMNGQEHGGKVFHLIKIQN